MSPNLTRYLNSNLIADLNSDRRSVGTDTADVDGWLTISAYPVPMCDGGNPCRLTDWRGTRNPTIA
jgi:hypothetical protein